MREGDGAGRVAGDDDGVRFGKLSALPYDFQNPFNQNIVRFFAVGIEAVIGEVDDIGLRLQAADLADDAEAANAGIEDEKVHGSKIYSGLSIISSGMRVWFSMCFART